MDPRREGAMETLRAIDQATARIDALIARAGGPMMICKNTKEADTEKKEQIMLYVRTISRRDFGGSVAMYFNHLIDTIDRMEAALHNTLNERDQMMKDMKKLVFRHGDCFACKHLTDGMIECCAHCNPKDNQSQWEWRGVPDKEE